MRNLIELLARVHRWLLFLALWGVALAWMGTTYGHHRTALARWSMRIAGSWVDAGSRVADWRNLSESNQMVMLENARLRAEIERLKSGDRQAWSARHARVLRSPGWNRSPWMVLDGGGAEGIAPGAGVLAMGHAAGKVVDTTAHEALVLTLVHPGAQWSVRLGRNGPSGRLVHTDHNVRQATVRDIPWAHLVLPGDTFFTTGHDGVFPADIPVGTVLDVVGTEADEFQEVHLHLGANFPAARHAVCLPNVRARRLDSLVESSESLTP